MSRPAKKMFFPPQAIFQSDHYTWYHPVAKVKKIKFWLNRMHYITAVLGFVITSIIVPCEYTVLFLFLLKSNSF